MGETLGEAVPLIPVLDSSAMLAFVDDEPGADIVELLLRDSDDPCYAHSVNLCEVYYGIRRRDGEAAAQEVVRDLSTSVIIRDDMDVAFWQDAGAIKADHRRVSLADCFCIALARRLNGELITTDHHEFDALVPLGLCRITFIR